MFNDTELGDIVKNAPEKPGCIEMLPYSTASYLVNELNKEPVLASRKDLDVSTATDFITFPEEMLKSGSFVTILRLCNVIIKFEKYYKKISCISHHHC